MTEKENLIMNDVLDSEEIELLKKYLSEEDVIK